MLLHLGIDRVFVAMNGIHQHGSLFIIFGWLPRPGNLVVLCTRGSTPSRPWLCFFQRVCVCVCVGSLLLRRSVHFDIDRATLSSLCACQIDVAVARCWGSCSEILTMRSVLADLRRDLDKRSLPEILLRDLSERTCTDILFKDLWSLAKILPRDFLQRERELVQRSCHKTSFTDLLPQPFIQISCRDLAKRSLTEIILRDLQWRAWTEILFRHLQQDITWRGFFGDLVTGSLQRCCVDLLQRSCQETCHRNLDRDLV